MLGVFWRTVARFAAYAEQRGTRNAIRRVRYKLRARPRKSIGKHLRHAVSSGDLAIVIDAPASPFMEAIGGRFLVSGWVKQGFAGIVELTVDEVPVAKSSGVYRRDLPEESRNYGFIFWVPTDKMAYGGHMVSVRSGAVSRTFFVFCRGSAGSTTEVESPVVVQGKVGVVIPTYGSVGVTLTKQCVSALVCNQPKEVVGLVVVDDGSTESEYEALVESLAEYDGKVQILHHEMNRGFAATVNRGIAWVQETFPGADVLLLNNDVIAPGSGWLGAMVARLTQKGVGIVGARLLYGDGRVQHAGIVRLRGSRQYAEFEHLGRNLPGNHSFVTASRECIAVTGACMLIRGDVIRDIGQLSEQWWAAFEDVEYCYRAREHGWSVWYEANAILFHLEGQTRGRTPGEKDAFRAGSAVRELQYGQEMMNIITTMSSRSSAGTLKEVIWALPFAGHMGGERIVGSLAQSLAGQGIRNTVVTLGSRDDFPFDGNIVTVASYDDMLDYLSLSKGLKIATWWETAPIVAESLTCVGSGVYFVQDIEASFYDDVETRKRVWETYSLPLRLVTTSRSAHAELQSKDLSAEFVSIGIDLDRFVDRGERRTPALLVPARTHAHKGWDIAQATITALAERHKHMMFWTYSREEIPTFAPNHMHYCNLTDEEVVSLMNRASWFFFPSLHEGFGLPLLEAMACGLPSVTFDATGNRGYIKHEVNCIVAPTGVQGAVDALEVLMGSTDMQTALRNGGYETTREYSWDGFVERFSKFLAREYGL